MNIIIIISVFFSVYDFGLYIDTTATEFMYKNVNNDKKFKNIISNFFKYTTNVINIVLPTLPTINPSLNITNNLRAIIPLVEKPIIDTNNIPCSLDIIEIYYPDPEKIAQCVADTVLVAWNAMVAGISVAAEEALKAGQVAITGVTVAAEETAAVGVAIAESTVKAAEDTARAAETTYNTAVQGVQVASQTAKDTIKIAENAVKTAEDTAAAVVTAYHSALQGVEVASQAATQAADTAKNAANATAQAASDAVNEATVAVNNATNVGYSAVKNSVSSTISIATNLGNILGDGFGSITNLFGRSNFQSASNQGLKFYDAKLKAISHYLTLSREIKKLYYKDPFTRQIFDKFTIVNNLYPTILGRNWYGYARTGPNGLKHNLLEAIWAWSNAIWDPLKNPTILWHIKNGTLTFNILKNIYINPAKEISDIPKYQISINYLDRLIKHKIQLAGQVVKDSRQQNDNKLQQIADNLQQIALVKQNQFNQIGPNIKNSKNGIIQAKRILESKKIEQQQQIMFKQNQLNQANSRLINANNTKRLAKEALQRKRIEQQQIVDNKIAQVKQQVEIVRLEKAKETNTQIQNARLEVDRLIEEAQLEATRNNIIM